MTRWSFPARPAGLRPKPIAIIAAYAATVVIWGTTWLGIKVSLTGLPPVTGVGLRFCIAGAVLYGVALAAGTDLRRRPPLHLVAVLAVTMFGLNYLLTYLAESHLASGLVAVLYGTLPFFVFALAQPMLGERATPKMILGAALALCGVALISLVGDLRANGMYVLAAIVATASSAFANVYLKRHAGAEPFVTLPPAMLLAGSVLAAWGIASEHVAWHRAVAAPSLLALLYLAVFGSAFAFYLNHWLLQRIDSGVVGLSALMIPVLAVAVGVAYGGERFSPRDLAGAVLVLGGVWLAMPRRGETSPGDASPGDADARLPLEPEFAL